MIYYSDAFLDGLLQEDIHYGDLTTRALGIGNQRAEITFSRKETGCVSGIALACKLLKKLDITISSAVIEGDIVTAGSPIITAQGSAAALHQGWKIVQNVLEWSCGVSQYMHDMLSIARKYQPHAQIACTRKNIPGTKLLATQAILAAGGIIHRQGCSETILLFANHRHFLEKPDDWQHAINQLRLDAPEKAIIVEADNMQEAYAALAAQPDILQLDKFSPDDIRTLIADSADIAPHCQLSAAGGINLQSIDKYTNIGIKLFVTSAPYYAQPADIKVRLYPL